MPIYVNSVPSVANPGFANGTYFVESKQRVDDSRRTGDEQNLLIRGQKVILDRDLAELYGVGTKVLKQAVKRNAERFPEDFMFEMTAEELENWRSQFVTSNSDKMGLRYPPFCFTEQGVAMPLQF